MKDGRLLKATEMGFRGYIFSDILIQIISDFM